MSTECLPTQQKALAVNLDRTIYGTIAEIGAGQEVARWFFSVGGAAGTVAKSMSAYDKTVSEQIYGKVGRYVSRERLISMLDHEFDLLLDQLGEAEKGGTRLFAFADTVTAQNYQGTNECQGWVGLRFQHVPGGEASDVFLHVNMLDGTNFLQQEALGVLGINLIYAAFNAMETEDVFLQSLGEELSLERLEIDLVHMIGPRFEGVEPLETGLILVRRGLAQAVLFDATGELVPPTVVLHKRPVIIERGLFQRPEEIEPRRLRVGMDHLPREQPGLKRDPIALMELSVNNVREGREISDLEYLGRLKSLLPMGRPLLLTRLRESYSLTGYLRRYSQQPFRFVLGVSTMALLFRDAYYSKLPGGLLEGIGKLLADNVKIYVHSMEVEAVRAHLLASGVEPGFVTLPESGSVSVGEVVFRSPLELLYRYLVEVGWVVPVVLVR